MAALNPDELRAWLALLTARGLGRHRAIEALRHFGGALEVVHSGAAAWDSFQERPFRATVLAAWQATEQLARDTLSWLRMDADHHVITLEDSRYPQALLQGPDPPLMLFLAGKPNAFDGPMVAMVGSRHATPYGRAFARRLSADLTTCGATVVSGLALGIDAAAHLGALDADGITVAVVGNGLDVVYPSGHADLSQRIQHRGCVVSEHPLGTPALPAHFPSRNRIIAGLSGGVVVVEAALRSGSLITARLAAEAGRDVFAVPGALTSPQSAGCHALIKQGAGLVEGIDDLLAALPGLLRPQERGRSESDASCPDSMMRVLQEQLSAGPRSLDELTTNSAMTVARWQDALLAAELDGMVARLPGGRFQWLDRRP